MQNATTGRHPGAAAPHGMDTKHPNWEEIYARGPRWDIGRPQPAFLALAGSGAISGRVLDVGCGTGEHVLMCAALGLDATGVDIAGAAIDAAERKAHERGLNARFLRHDVRRLAELGESFDTVLDSGLLVHVIDDEQDRAAYLQGLRAVLPPGGRYFVLCFRGPQSGSGPRHLMREDVTACFTEGWRVDTTEETTLDSLTDEDGIPAWRIALTRI
ncbi:Methyltransferase domain-containing protein [Microbispora rosea]|uniref:Methyltransferase domain-containing protein n=1 Tax=Microbispora rosea TaxID=58117 RepID=A0A1N7G890_9ACTN|nr:class I SAM-dependent methyltransferase [Microbispora rosea]GIH46294.1 SAM-dependent methyltransferase [Microbispora rosea subsp. rosea]SIS08768.1 Methyltransferase domain-containing protein [Microbispora rosea]